MDWNEMMSEEVDAYLQSLGEVKAFQEAHGDLVDRAETVQRRFGAEAIQGVTWEEFVAIFRRFDNVRVNPGRMLRIFGSNDADRLRGAIRLMLHDRKPVEDRLRQASGHQLGEGFLSELLCYYRPYQWPVKSLRTARGLARISHVFQTSEMEELSYEQYRKFLLPIATTFQSRLAAAGWDETFWARYRFLIVYRWLCEAGRPARRRRRGV